MYDQVPPQPAGLIVGSGCEGKPPELAGTSAEQHQWTDAPKNDHFDGGGEELTTNHSFDVRPLQMVENYPETTTTSREAQPPLESKKYSTSCTPSSSKLDNLSRNRVSDVLQCTFDINKICVIHNVHASITSVTSKKWGYLKNKKGYGWINKKVEKLTCRTGLEIRRSSSTQPILNHNLDKNLFCGEGRSDSRGLVNFEESGLEQ